MIHYVPHMRSHEEVWSETHTHTLLNPRLLLPLKSRVIHLAMLVDGQKPLHQELLSPSEMVHAHARNLKFTHC